MQGYRAAQAAALWLPVQVLGSPTALDRGLGAAGWCKEGCVCMSGQGDVLEEPPGFASLTAWTTSLTWASQFYWKP